MTVVVLVVLHNVLFGVACLWVAWRIWRFRLRLSRLSVSILNVEMAVHRVLYPAPNKIIKAQSGTSRLRQRYQALGVQAEKARRIAAFLSMTRIFWSYRNLLGYPKAGARHSSKKS